VPERARVHVDKKYKENKEEVPFGFFVPLLAIY
jgi:hypothetical protein